MLFYTGLHYLLFKFLAGIGITDPQAKMYLVRLIHAVWSMLIIFYGYKITKHFADDSDARKAGWLLALFWMFPFLSVRNLVEFVSVPFLIYGTWLIVKNELKFSVWKWLWIGILFGLAFNIRMQTLLYSGGIGLVLLYQKKWKETIILGFGIILTVLALQGGIDYFIWGKPFTQLQSYVDYNMKHSMEYTTGPWYHYVLFLLGFLIPPVSIFLFFGFFRSYNKVLVIFIPTLIFFIFHSWYPNKQERFITTIVPFIMINGIIGWKLIEDGLFNPKFVQKFIKWSWVFFWVINLIFLIPVSTMYSKKARVESMSYLSQYDDLKYFIIEDATKNVLRFPPQFYLKKWIQYDAIMKNSDFQEFSRKRKWEKTWNQPEFVLFVQPEKLEERVNKMKTLFPDLVHEKTIEPGMIDMLLHWLNPINDNQNIYIYRNAALIKEKIIE